MKNLKVLFAISLVAGILFCATVTRADSLPIYLVQGTMAFTGTSACTPGPCTQEVAFEFEWTYTAQVTPDEPTLYTGYMVPGSSSGMTLGNLGFATLTSIGWGDWEYLGFGNPTFPSSFDTYILNVLTLSPDAPILGDRVDMYGCGTVQCAQDFLSATWSQPVGGYVNSGTLNYTATELPLTATPEPSTWLLVLGAALVMLFMNWKTPLLKRV